MRGAADGAQLAIRTVCVDAGLPPVLEEEKSRAASNPDVDQPLSSDRSQIRGMRILLLLGLLSWLPIVVLYLTIKG